MSPEKTSQKNRWIVVFEAQLKQPYMNDYEWMTMRFQVQIAIKEPTIMN